MNMAAAGISFLVIPALVAIIVLIFMIGFKNAARKKASKPIQTLTVSATVSSKRYDYVEGELAYIVSFNTPTGIIELTLPADQFELIAEGDKGTLVYQDNRFLGFTK